MNLSLGIHNAMEKNDRSAEACKRLLADPVRYFGASVLRIEPVRTIQCSYSTVRHVRVLTTESRRDAYLKQYREFPGQAADLLGRRVEHEFREMLHAHVGLARKDGLSAPRPVAAFPDLKVFVSEEASGRSLSSLLRSGRGRDPAHLIDVLERVGAWLRAYAALPVSAGRLDPEKVRSYTEARLARLLAAPHGAVNDADAGRIRAGMGRWLNQLRASDLDVVQMHGDFNPENILIDGRRVCVIDFSEAHAGPRLYDLVHLYLHLERLKGRLLFPAGVADRLQQALLHGYGQPGAVAEPLFRLMTIEQIGCYLTRITEDCPRRARLMRRAYLRFKRAHAFRTLEGLGILEAATAAPLAEGYSGRLA